MKKIIAGMLAMALLLTACSAKVERGEVSENLETSKTEVFVELSETGIADNVQTVEQSVTDTAGSQEIQEAGTQIGTEIEPLLSEKIDTSRQGVVMSFNKELASEMTKGDDGSCYYFRTKGKGKNKKIVFYKNNGIMVCETAVKKAFKEKMYKKYKKYKYYITAIAKYGDYFFVAFYSPYTYKILMTTVDIETGKWGSLIKIPDATGNNAIIYDNHIYYIEEEGDVTVYDLSGRETYLGYLGPKGTLYGARVRCIVDDKIYYTSDDYSIKRCNLKGKKKETLFAHNYDIIEEEDKIESLHPETLRIDGDYIYALVFVYSRRCYELIRIPLYGGKVQKVAENLSYYFELSEDSIFFLSGNNGDDDSYNIYKIDKGLTNEPVAVAKACDFLYYCGVKSSPFHCADGHLIVQDIKKKERKVLDGILHDEYSNWGLFADVRENYAPDWYWVSEDGTIEDTIKGSGMKKKWKKYANK